jgi:alpha-galactosidase
VTEQVVGQTAAALARSGMRAAGYRYVNLDDCWMAWARSATGDLQPDHARFPGGIPPLAKLLHENGMKLGIYLSAGPTTCRGRPGSYGYLSRDIAKVASWGVDFIKIDWCAAREQGANAQKIYTEAQAAVAATGRPIVLSISEWGGARPWRWAARVAHMWRTTRDIPHYNTRNRWSATLKVASLTERVADAAAPGGWNDPDFLQVGLANFTRDENRAVMAIWAMLAAPLIASNDVRRMTPGIRAILTNGEVIAIDQDQLGRAGRKVLTLQAVDLWVREMANGDRVLMILNRRVGPIRWWANADQVFGRNGSRWRIHDVWTHGTTFAEGRFVTEVPGHGVALFRISPA